MCVSGAFGSYQECDAANEHNWPLSQVEESKTPTAVMLLSSCEVNSSRVLSNNNWPHSSSIMFDFLRIVHWSKFDC